MAYKSLIDYYGGGMVKPSKGYALGGLVAGARRQRDYSGELRNIQKLAEQSAARKAKAQRKGGLLKTALGFGGTLLGGPMGSAIGSALGQHIGEKSYTSTDFGGGKYAQDVRGMLGKQEKAYEDQGLARVGLAGLSGYGAGKAGGMFGKAAGGIKGFGSDVGMIKEAMKGEGGASFLEAAKGVGWDIPSVFGGEASEVGKSLMAATAPKVASAAQAAPTIGKKIVTSVTDKAASEEPVGVPYFGGDRNVVTEESVPMSNIYQPAGYPHHNVGDIVEESAYQGPPSPSGFMAAVPPYETMEGSEYLPAGIPDQPQIAGGAGGGGYFDNLFGGRSFGDIMGQGASNMLQGLYTTGSLLGGASNPYNKKGGGLIEGLMPRGYQSGGQVGYGTATSPEEALRQMGMGDVADDPRLGKYMEDLPQFTMGYKQQLGDITSGARSSLMDISQQGRMQQAGSGFAGGGAGAMGQSRAREGLQRQFGTQKRGLVEGYQADLLSAIADIEGKGGFEFGNDTTRAEWQQNAPVNDAGWNPPSGTEGATYNYNGANWVFSGGSWITEEEQEQEALYAQQSDSDYGP